MTQAETGGVVNSVMRGCAVLGHFTPEHPEWTLSGLQDATGLNKTTVYRLLHTFITAGWVNRSDDGRYSINGTLFRIGSAAYFNNDLRAQSTNYLRQLSDSFGDTAFLMVPSQDGAVCVDMVVGSAPLSINGLKIGSVLPYNAAAGPIAMLAEDPALLSDAGYSTLKKLTERTLSTRKDLEEALVAIKSRGYSISNNDYFEGVSAVAAAVVSGGELIGSLSLGGASERFDSLLVHQKGEAVMTAAKLLGQQLNLGV